MTTRRNHHDAITSGCTFPAMFAAATLFAGLAAAQDPVSSEPYGHPSESGHGTPATLGLYLTGSSSSTPHLRLEGGTPGAPAVLLFASTEAKLELPAGGTAWVAAPEQSTYGTFDDHGVFAIQLTNASFTDDRDELFVQGVQPVKYGAELSGGLRLTLERDDDTPEELAPLPPEGIIVEEFGDLMFAGHLEAALDTALNSAGDSLALNLSGSLQVPIVVVPGLTVGGSVATHFEIVRDEDDAGSTVYDVIVGGDVAKAAGYGVGAAGVELSRGVGIDVVSRFSSTHEVARAVRAMLILQAVRDDLELACILVDGHLADVDRSIRAWHGAMDRVRRTFRSWMPWRNAPVIRRIQARMDSLRARRRAIMAEGRRVLEQLIGFVASERVFLIEHLHGTEIRSTTAFEGSIGVGIGFGGEGSPNELSGAVVGANISGEVERQFVTRAESLPDHSGFALEFEQVFAKSVAGNAGMGIGVAAAAGRELSLRLRVESDLDGIEIDRGEVEVQLTLDGELLGALGAFVGAQAGVGGEVVATMGLEDVQAAGSDALAMLLDGDADAAADLLRALAPKFSAQGSYRAGFVAGIGLDIEGAFEFEVGGTAMLTDWGTKHEFDFADVVDQFIDMRSDDAARDREPQLRNRLDAVLAEVESVMQR